MANIATVSRLVREAYYGLGPWARADEDVWELLQFVEALFGQLVEIDDLVRDTDTHVGWGRLLDVDAAPEWALPWLAQFVGVTPIKGLDAASQRLRIKEAAGFHRGSVKAIKAAAGQYLTGTRRVELYERDPVLRTTKEVWGHGGSTAARGAASPALIDLAALGVPRVLWLPGALDNYVSTPDKNLLTPAQSLGSGGWGAGNSTSGVTYETAAPISGTSSVRLTQNGAAGEQTRASTNAGGRAPVSASTSYAAQVKIKALTAARDVQHYVEFFDSAGAYITSTRFGGAVTPAVGAVTTVSGVLTSPANAATAIILVMVVGAAQGEAWLIDDAQLEQATAVSPFTPSMRVTGDIDIQAHVALEDWTPADYTHILGKRIGGTAEYVLRLINGGTGRLQLYWWEGATAVLATSSAAVPFTDGEPGWVRAVRRNNNGAATPVWEVTFYTSRDGVVWTQLGAVVAGTAVANPTLTNNPLTAGAIPGASTQALKGKVLSASVRAGIDGPVVAAYDSSEHTAVTYTDSTGKVWTISRAGDATAEVVDRSTWAFTGTEYLTLPDRNELDADSDGFTVAASIFSRSTVNYSRIATKRGSGNTNFYSLTSDVRMEAFDDTGHTAQTASARTGAWTEIAGQIERDNVGGGELAAYREGVAGAVVAPPDRIKNAEPLVIGAWTAAMAAAHRGFISWVAVFRRTLTAAEHTTLAAWDGSIEREPRWLRDAAVLYLNADDPEQAEAYRARNEVVNVRNTYDTFPWRFRIRTYESETPDAQAVKDAVAALKPAGLVFIHEVQRGLSINQMVGTIDQQTGTIDSYSNVVPT